LIAPQCIYSLDAILKLSTSEFANAVDQALSRRLSFFPITPEQHQAWLRECEWIYNFALEISPTNSKIQVIFEYAPPHVSGRPDMIILAGAYVFVVEAKTGLERTDAQATRQSLNYAKNIWNHVRACRSKIVIPILLQDTKFKDYELPKTSADPESFGVYVLSPLALINLVKKIPTIHSAESLDGWIYAPRPSITQAAVALMGALEDPAVTTGLADDKEILRLSKLITKNSLEDRRLLRHSVVLVIGKPGAGKTLVGLRLAHDPEIHREMADSEEPPLFLSGNGPLVDILTEALARDHSSRLGTNLNRSREIAATKILLVHKLVSDEMQIATNIVIFDEGQRVWSEERMRAKHDSGSIGSEAEEILKKLETHQWATLVVLCGTGQEINRGEFGLETWIKAVESRRDLGHRIWRLSGPEELNSASISAEDLIIDDAYSLQVVRRAENASQIGDWVNSVLRVEIETARETRKKFPDFPLAVTRDLSVAKSWLIEKKDRGERAGLTISALSERMSIYGIDVRHGARSDHPWVNWFLDEKPNLNSSQYLEVPASEFQCQGLELDWVGVCWSWDLVLEDNKWIGRRIKKRTSSWTRIKKDHAYRVNAYRVLLTRSRKGMVIWVPEGDDGDKSRQKIEMDEVFALLVEAGCEVI
jgi:DUF2075 family protein